MRLKNLSLQSRIFLLVSCGLLIAVAILISSFMQNREALYQARYDSVRQATEVAYSTLKHYQQQAEAGNLSVADAQKAAKDVIRAMRFSEVEYFFIYDMNHTSIMHGAKPDLEGKNLADLQDPNGLYVIRELVNVVKADGKGFLDYGWPRAGEQAPSPKTGYVIGFEPWNWFIGSGVYVDDIETVARQQLMILGGIALVGTALMAGAALVIGRSITSPILSLRESMNKLAAGEEIEALDTDRKDEIGEMAKAVEVFRQNAVEKQSLSAASVEKEQADKQRQQKIEQLIEGFRSDVLSSLQGVSSQSEAMQSIASRLAEVASGASEQVNTAADETNRASHNVQTVASAAEELSSSISEITRQVSTTTQVVQKATLNAQNTNAKISSLAQAAQKIGDVVSLISDIAEQTNLLALNATIEAARAGEAGKGFAVVASEVKALASQTAKATEEISQQISAIQGSTEEAVQAIHEITSTMDEVNSYTSSIATSVEEQRHATDEISQNIQLAAAGTTTMAGSMGYVRGGINETNDAAGKVLSASSDVSSQSAKLRNTVDQFLKSVAAA